MDIEIFRDFCLSLKGTIESFPFDDKTIVFKVNHKMYALADIISFEFINLKCNPEKAEILRAEYEAVKPGWHMNKKHWNSIYINMGGGVDDNLIFEWITDSYNLVLKKTKNKK